MGEKDGIIISANANGNPVSFIVPTSVSIPVVREAELSYWGYIDSGLDLIEGFVKDTVALIENTPEAVYNSATNLVQKGIEGLRNLGIAFSSLN